MNNTSKSKLVESRCPKCGAVFHVNSKFCAFDGAELAVCEAVESGSNPPSSGKQCTTCATKYSTAKQFCGVDGSVLVPWFDSSGPLEEEKEDSVGSASSDSGTGSGSSSAELPRRDKSTLEILAQKPGLPTKEQNWNFSPETDTSLEPASFSTARDVNNLSLVDFEKVTEALILEHAQKADMSTGEEQPGVQSGVQPSGVQSGGVQPNQAQPDEAHKPSTTEMPADKLSQVDFELVTEWLTIDQSEQAVQAAPKIESRIAEETDDQTDITEAKPTREVQIQPGAPEAEPEPGPEPKPETKQQANPGTKLEQEQKTETELDAPVPVQAQVAAEHIRPEDLDKTVESSATRLQKAEVPEQPSASPLPASLSEDNSFADDLKLIGKTLEGKYAIKSVLAEGGMAVLYLADHTTMERTVVVKVVHNYLRSSKGELERFEREAKTVARLNHPNIVSLYDFGFIEDQSPFIVMEYIRGMNLAQKVIRHGPPRIAVAIRIIKQICRGLEEAHRCGIIHRDLKPDNIILQDKFDRPDWVKLVDFGIAHMLDNKGKRLTRAGLLIGTPEYASPEQFKDLPLDTRSDIYSLGVVLFGMFTGQLPYEAGNLAALMTKILLEPAPSICPYRDDIEPDSPIDLLIQKCLEKDPEDRFQTMTDVRLAAESAYESDTQP